MFWVDLLPWFVVAAMLLGGVVGAVFMVRLQRTYAGRRRATMVQIVVMFGLMVAFAFSLPAGLAYGPGGATPVLFGLAGLLCVWQLLKPRSEREARQEYRRDPAHCGRCGYATFGVEGDICPECGWRYLRPDEPVEAPDWAAWWSQGWRIDYLEHWRRNAWIWGFWILAFAGLAIGLWVAYASPVALFAGLMAVMMAINLIRILQYARNPRNHPRNYARAHP